MPRCPDCSKFVSLEPVDPECDGLECDGTSINGSVRIAMACADCGTELKEYSFDVSQELPEAVAAHLAAHDGEDGHEIELEGDADAPEFTDRTEGKGRGARTFYGFNLVVRGKCSCGDASAEFEATISDDVQASHMEELT